MTAFQIALRATIRANEMVRFAITMMRLSDLAGSEYRSSLRKSIFCRGILSLSLSLPVRKSGERKGRQALPMNMQALKIYATVSQVP